MLRKTDILGVGITDASEGEVLEYVFSFLREGSKKGYIVTPNPEIVTHAQAHPQYMKILNKADVALCDGVGLSLAGRLLGKHLSGRIAGVDLVEMICMESVRKAFTVGFLGAGRDVALKAAECLSVKYPGLRVGFLGEEWSDEGFVQAKKYQVEKDHESAVGESSSTSAIRNSGDAPREIDMLFVAFGFPKQEEWISENLDKIPVKIAMGVGGAFDYISGAVPRAPFIVRSLGMEWLFRLLVQPWRLRRQVKLLSFVKLVLRERMNSNR